MEIGKRADWRQHEFWVETESLAIAARHVFYDRLNGLLAEAGFDRFVESSCEAYYHDGGRPSIPPGTYFRMLLLGYFEDISSHRLALFRQPFSAEVSGHFADGRDADHSSVTRISKRLPSSVNGQVFEFVLKIAAEKKLIKPTTVAVDSTTLEANAAMRAISARITAPTRAPS